MQVVVIEYNTDKPHEKVYTREKVEKHTSSWDSLKTSWTQKMNEGLVYCFRLTVFEYYTSQAQFELLDSYEASNVVKPRIVNA